MSFTIQNLNPIQKSLNFSENPSPNGENIPLSQVWAMQLSFLDSFRAVPTDIACDDEPWKDR